MSNNNNNNMEEEDEQFIQAFGEHTGISEGWGNDLVVQIAELTRQRVALSAKNDQLSSRLALIDSGDMNQQSVVGKEDKGNGGSSSKKRQRN